VNTESTASTSERPDSEHEYKNSVTCRPIDDKKRGRETPVSTESLTSTSHDDQTKPAADGTLSA
jgi:hypothetical protein